MASTQFCHSSSLSLTEGVGRGEGVATAGRLLLSPAPLYPALSPSGGRGSGLVAPLAVCLGRELIGAAARPIVFGHAWPHALASCLESAQDGALVGALHAAGVHHEPAVDVDTVHVLVARVVDDVLDGIAERRHPPRRRLPEHEIGLGPGSDAS